MPSPDAPLANTDHLGHRQRLRQRLLDAGPEALADYEILELLLCLAIPQKDVKPLAKQLMARFDGLAGVLSAEPTQLMNQPGIKENAAAALRLVAAAATRLARSEVISRPVISSWDRLLDYCRIAFANIAQERLHLLFLDRKNALIADETQQRGTIDHTPAYPREVVRRCLELNASALIVVHNHPSGDPTASAADIAVTKRLADATGAIGITLHDHLIIAKSGVFSFRAQGLL